MDNKYTLAEIDRMRAALWRKHAPPRFDYPSGAKRAKAYRIIR